MSTVLRFKQSDICALLVKYDIPSLSLPAHVLRKRNHFSFMNKSANMQCKRRNLVRLLLMNIIVDVTYLIYEI